MCGFYLNELILRLLPREDPHEALFDAYGEALARLSAGDAFPAVRAWLYVAIVGVGYMISRGLAKAGSRDPYWSSTDELPGARDADQAVGRDR